MKKILLVDDEVLVRAGLRTIVDWNANGYEIMGEAASGHEAMKIIEQDAPDILLTDMVMDDGNGIELTKWCIERYPTVNIIILSNYTDYDNVRIAMKLGAKDYLFKLTISGEEMLKTLNSLPIEKKEDAIYQLVERNADAIRQKLFIRMLKGNIDDFDAWKKDFQLVSGSFMIDEPYAMLYLKLGDFALLTGDKEKENAAAVSVVETALEKQFCHSSRAQFFRYQVGQYYVLINLHEKTLSTAETMRLQKLFSDFSNYCERFLGLRCDCVYLGPCQSFDHIHDNVLQCEREMERFFFAEQGDIRQIKQKNGENTAEEKADDCFYQPDDDMKTVVQTFNTDDSASVLAAVETFFDHLRAHGGDVRKTRECLNELYIYLWNAMKKRGCYIDEYVDANLLSLYEAIYSYDYLSSIRVSFIGAFHFYFSHLSLNEQTIHPIVLQTMVYIREHLKEDLTIPSLCQRVHMSESAFTRLFKKETGMNMVKYINSVRIERAYNLLGETDMKIQEVAETVGVDNPNYFSILFKKVTGLSPIEYRARIMQEK